MAEMVIWLDSAGRYVFVNKAATQLLEYTSEEFLRMRVWNVAPLFSEKKWQEHWRELEENQSLKIETVNRKKSGQDIPIEVSASLVVFENEKFNCSVVRDMSVYKQSENDLRALHQKVFQLSITDALTGIANRRHFDEVLVREIERHKHVSAPLSVILLDVDYFKAYNDFYGHVAGDECLQAIGQILDHVITMPASLAARYGGEEFVCILSETTQNEAVKLASKIKDSIHSLKIRHLSSPGADCVTCSLGVLTLNSSGLSPREVLNAVDLLLYSAKRAGRNRVVSGVK
ncbi:sensor domain-containing diguanylate cyclase [Pantoea ananatis]|nr:sensor domain-containing diguanylate cyclase [Pantoea ananatis]MDI6539876.1 sensor domain-containing diguanylate cyclase [Pantoea ananatis]